MLKTSIMFQSIFEVQLSNLSMLSWVLLLCLTSESNQREQNLNARKWPTIGVNFFPWDLFSRLLLCCRKYPALQITWFLNQLKILSEHLRRTGEYYIHLFLMSNNSKSLLEVTNTCIWAHEFVRLHWHFFLF